MGGRTSETLLSCSCAWKFEESRVYVLVSMDMAFTQHLKHDKYSFFTNKRSKASRERDFKRHGKLQVDPQQICGLCDCIMISKIIFQKNVSIQTTYALLGQWPLTSQIFHVNYWQ